MHITYESSHSGYPINTNKEKELGCNIQILNRIQKHLEYAKDHHSKVLMTRIDMRYPLESEDECKRSDLTRFIKNITRDLERNNKLPKEGKVRSTKISAEDKRACTSHVDPMITLVAEQTPTGRHPHVHAFITVNGNIKNKPDDIRKRVIRQWSNAIHCDKGGLVDFCDKRGPGSAMLNRNSPDFREHFDEVFRQVSYLAKNRDKDDRPKGSWLVMGSRIPKEPCNGE